MAKRDYGWAIPPPNAWSGGDQPPRYKETMRNQSHRFQATAPPAAYPLYPPLPAYPAYPDLGPVCPPQPDYLAPDGKSPQRRNSFEVQRAAQQDYKAELQTKAISVPQPPPLPPLPRRPQQDTKGTTLGALSTNSRKKAMYVHPQQSTQGLHPHRPPPPPPTEAKTLTRQDTFDEYQPAEEPLYIYPEEINPKRLSDPVEEPLYIEVLPDTEPHRPPLHHSVSDNPSAPHYSNSPLAPPLPAARQIRHQLSLPARLPQGLENAHKVSQEELEILLEWWSTAKDTVPISHQVQANDIAVITNEAHRVRLALHLYEGLLFHRGQIFNDYITQLYCLADRLDNLHRKTRIAGIAGGTSGAVGGVAAVAGVVLAPLTFGVSLAVTAVGVGVAAAGGLTGASMAIKNKMSDTKERKKVEEIMQSYRSQMEDVEACLKFINTAMEGLQKYKPVRGMDKDAVRVLRLAQVISRQSFHLRPTGRSSGILDGFAVSMDVYFTKEDKERLRKGSETKFARKIRELAKQLKGGLDELLQVRDTVRSAIQQVVIR